MKAGEKALAFDGRVYKAAGKDPRPIAASPSLQAVIEAGLKKTMRLYKNLTGTIANTATKQFEDALDRAYLQVASGAFSHQQAVRGAVKGLAKAGLQAIRYPSGHRGHMDVAVRRAVLTGLNQTCAELQLTRAGEMGSDLVQVTSHLGARPEHAVWQGEVFSRSGKHPVYPEFTGATGYGTGPGLCGWNCRHSFYPFFEGLSADVYERYGEEENNERYAQTQRQRALERRIRQTKRECAAYDAAGLREDFAAAAAKLKRQEQALKDHLKATGLPRRKDREQVLGFGHSQSSKAVWSAKKQLKGAGKSGIINAGRDNTMQRVNTGGRRNEKPLDEHLVETVKQYACTLGMPREQIRYGEHYNTAYGSNFDMLYLGTDVLPANGARVTPNSRISWKGAVAHEIIGHRESALKGWAIDENPALDEAQASIRAARFAPGLTMPERITLLRDALGRLRNGGIRLSVARKQMHITER